MTRILKSNRIADYLEWYWKLMIERIPQRIDYHRYTEQGVTLDGVMSLSESIKDLPRLNEAIIRNIGDISYYLAFDTDVVGNRFVSGHIGASVVLPCQRCMDNYQLDLQCDLSIAFVGNDFEQKRAEESNYDTFWLAKKSLFDPRVLIEDELLLALPQIPMHPLSEIGKDCDVQVKFLDDTEEVVAECDDLSGQEIKQNRENPFAILKQLKND